MLRLTSQQVRLSQLLKVDPADPQPEPDSRGGGPVDEDALRDLDMDACYELDDEEQDYYRR